MPRSPGVIGSVIVAVHLIFIAQWVLSSGESEVVRGTVVAVPEGDALVVAVNRERVTLRLSEIDAPKLDQPYAVQSRQSLEELALGRYVDCAERGRDRFGRTAVRCRVNGTDLNAEQVGRGMAWVFDRYRKDDRLRARHEEARTAKRGLWQDASPVPPWSWRTS